MSTNTDKTRQEELHQAAENLSYWMFESSGRSEYVLAGRKPLYPDEATVEIEKLVNQQVLAALDKVKYETDGYRNADGEIVDIVPLSAIEEIEKEYKV